MKTRNSKLQKTELNSLINLIVLFAAVLVLNNQADAIGKITHKNAGTEAYAEMVNAENEAYLNIENWMLNENNFFDNYSLEAETEASLEVESWMTKSTAFITANYLDTETEETLNVAEWMLAETNFLPVFSLETEMENAMEIENWMIDAKIFAVGYALETETEEVLNLEEWMLNDSMFYSSAPVKAESDELAMNTSKEQEKIITIEYKDAASGYSFLFRLAEVDEPILILEKWMVDKKYWVRK